MDTALSPSLFTAVAAAGLGVEDCGSVEVVRESSGFTVAVRVALDRVRIRDARQWRYN